MTRRLIALGVGAFLILLVVTLPAQLFAGLLARQGIQVTGVSGSVWKGQAQNLMVRGVGYGQLTWDLEVLSLLRGRGAADIDLRNGPAFATGHVAISLSGVVRAEDFNASWPLTALAVPGLPRGWLGSLQLDLRSAEFVDGLPRSLDGTVDLVDLVGPPAQPVALGGFRTVFTADAAAGPDQPVRATLQDTSGPIELNGTLVLGPGRSYRLDGQIATRPGAPANLGNALQYLGEADAAGRRPFTLSGTY